MSNTEDTLSTVELDTIYGGTPRCHRPPQHKPPQPHHNPPPGQQPPTCHTPPIWQPPYGGPGSPSGSGGGRWWPWWRGSYYGR